MKLVKVMDGLYRSENGAVRVALQMKWMGEPKHWTVKFEDIFGSRIVKKFATLAEVKEYLKQS